MTVLWQRLSSALQYVVPNARNGTLRPGAKDAAIEAAELKMQLALPEDLRTAYRYFDGVDFVRRPQTAPRVPPLIVPGCEWLPLVELVRLWSHHRDIAAALAPELGEPSPPQPSMRMQHTLWLDPRWIPIGEDNSGFFSAVDLHPGPAGRLGQLIQLSCGGGVETVAAPSFTEYIERLVVAIESGKLRASEGDWVDRAGRRLVASLDELD